MKKKLSTELSDQELINLLKNDTEVVGDKKKNNQHKFSKVLDFLSKYNIKSGNSMIFAGMLYELFKFENPDISLKSFIFQAKKVLPHEKQGRYNLFFINKESLEITEAVRKLYLTKPKNTISHARNMRRHVEGFIKYFKLKPGNNAVNFKIVADLYDRWTYKFKRKKISNQTLSKLLQLYLPYYKDSNNTDRFFKLNDDIFKIVSQRQLKNIANEQKEKNS